MEHNYYHKNSQILQQLMEQVQISSLQELSQISGVSEWQLSRLQQGLLPKMEIENLLKLADALQISVSKLLTIFLPESLFPHLVKQEKTSTELTSLRAEYQRIQQQLAGQKETLKQELTQSSLDILESWLIYWPTAVAAVKAHPNFPAKKLLPLVKPVEKLLAQWGVETIASVGEEIAYNPQYHELLEGNAQPGEMVKVRNVGYHQGDKLLYRVKVSPIN